MINLLFLYLIVYVHIRGGKKGMVGFQISLDNLQVNKFYSCTVKLLLDYKCSMTTEKVHCKAGQGKTGNKHGIRVIKAGLSCTCCRISLLVLCSTPLQYCFQTPKILKLHPLGHIFTDKCF